MKVVLVAEGVGVLARRLVLVVVLVGDVEVVRVAALAGELRRAGVGREVELALLDRGRDDGERDVREDDAGQDVDLVGLDHLVGELHGDVGLLLVVLGDDLDLGAGVAGLLQRQHEAVAHVDAEAGAAAGEGGDHADLDRRGARDGGGRGHQERGEAGGRGCVSSWFSSSVVVQASALAARSAKRWILPVAVFGSASTKTTERGYL